MPNVLLFLQCLAYSKTYSRDSVNSSLMNDGNNHKKEGFLFFLKEALIKPLFFTSGNPEICKQWQWFATRSGDQ